MTVRDGGATVNRNRGFYWNNGPLLYGGGPDTALLRPSAGNVSLHSGQFSSSPLGHLSVTGITLASVYFADGTTQTTAYTGQTGDWKIGVSGLTDTITSGETVTFTGLGNTTVTYNDSTNTVSISGTAGGGGGTPGGSNTQIQFNDAGSFGGSPAFTFDGSKVSITGTGLLFEVLNTSSDTLFSVEDSTESSIIAAAKVGQTGYVLDIRDEFDTTIAYIDPSGFISGAGVTFPDGVTQTIAYTGQTGGGGSSPTGTASGVAFFGGDNNLTDVSTFVFDSGNGRLGIGVANPLYDLHLGTNKDLFFQGGSNDWLFSVSNENLEIVLDPDSTSRSYLNFDRDGELYVGRGGNVDLWVNGANQNDQLIRTDASSGLVWFPSDRYGFGFGGIFDLYTAPDAQVDIRSSLSSREVLTVRGAASQSANLQEWQNSAGTVGAHVDSDGNIDTTGTVAASGGMTSHGLIKVKVGGNDQWLNNFQALPGYGMGVNVGAEQYFVINSQVNSVVGHHIRTNGKLGFYVGSSPNPTMDTAFERVSAGVASIVDVSGNLGQFIASGVSVSGLFLANHVPADTSNRLYNDGGTLTFNGSAVGGGTPGGSDTNIQFNNAGAFSGESNLSWDYNTDALTVSGSTLISNTGTVFQVTNTGGTTLFAVEDSDEVQVIVAAQVGQSGNPFEVRDEFDVTVASIDVSGNISGNNIIFGDGTIQTTAAAGGGTPTGTASGVAFFGDDNNLTESTSFTFDSGNKILNVFGTGTEYGTLKLGENARWVSRNGTAISYQSSAANFPVLFNSYSSVILASNVDFGWSANSSDPFGATTDTIVSRDAAGEVGFYKSGGSTYGTINVGNMVIDNPTSSNVNLVVKGAASQSANLQEWKRSDDQHVMSIDPEGNVLISGGLSNISTDPSMTIKATGGAAVYYAKNYLNDTLYMEMQGGQRSAKVGYNSAWSEYGGAWHRQYGGSDKFLDYNGSSNLLLLGTAGNTVLQISNYDTTIVSGLTVGGDADISGALTATTKSFLIDHPTKEGMKLQYGSLEGPENGVYVRGTTDLSTIELPDYWVGLVDENSITVSLTPVGSFQQLYVEDKNSKQITVGGVWGSYDYVVYAERKDVDKLEVEW